MSNYQYVNTKMGSFDHERYSNGNCYPVCAVPHGMNFFTLQTNGTNNWFYSPMDKSFEGIRLTHLPSPWLSDYNKLLIWGGSGEYVNDSRPYWSSFDNKANVIEPAYMYIKLHRDNYEIELTPTDTSAYLRFKFNQNASKNYIVLTSSNLSFEFDDKNSILYIKNCDAPSIFKGFDSSKPASISEYVIIKTNVPCTATEINGKIVLEAK